jgi:hypothetical protein
MRRTHAKRTAFHGAPVRPVLEGAVRGEAERRRRAVGLDEAGRHDDQTPTCRGPGEADDNSRPIEVFRDDGPPTVGCLGPSRRGDICADVCSTQSRQLHV